MEIKMKVWEKILLIVGAALLFVMMGFMLVKIYDLETQQAAIQTQVVKSAQLADGITRAMATYATKQEIQSFADNNAVNLKVIQDNLATLSASLSSINQVSVVSQGQAQNGVASTTTTPATKPTTTPTAPAVALDPFGYDNARQELDLTETFTSTKDATQTVSVPLGQVGFSAWQQKPWDFTIKPRDYVVDTVIGTDENDRQYAYNQFAIKTDNQTYPVAIKSSIVMQLPPSNSFSFWNPHLFITGGGAADLTKLGGDANVGATLGIMSYGRTKQTPIISILQVGAGYAPVDKRPALILNPIMFNIGRMVAPTNAVISNTYLGPSVQGDIVGGQAVVKAGLNLSVGL
jgi:hypothetical protein